jgi:hypothetical protein
MMFSAVPKQVIDIVWDDVVKILEPAVKTAKGKLSVKDVYDYGFYWWNTNERMVARGSTHHRKVCKR